MPTKHTSNSEQPNRRPSARRSGTARETSGSRRTTRGSDSRRTAEGRPTQRSRTSSRERGNMSPQRKTIMRWRDYGVRAFGAAMVIGCIVGLIFFARPTTSTLENRTLTPFPAVTAESFLDGTFTSDVSLWYADTFPLREPLVRMNLGLKNLYGVQPDTQLIGGNRTSDELPPEGERVAETRERPHNIAAPEVRERAANIEEQITDGVNGVLAELDENDLAEKILTLWRHPEKRIQLTETLKKEKPDFQSEYRKLQAFMYSPT